MKQGLRPPTLNQPFPDFGENPPKTNGMKVLQGFLDKMRVYRAFQRVYSFAPKSAFSRKSGAPRAAAEGTIHVLTGAFNALEPSSPTFLARKGIPK